MEKPRFQWPGNAHIAVVFNVAWESWDDKLGTSDDKEPAAPKIPATAPYTRGMRWIYEHAYAETGGMQRLLTLWDRHGIKVSCCADGLTISNYPGLARRMRDAGHELYIQGWDHSSLWALTVSEQEAAIDKSVAAFKKILGIQAAGFSSAHGNLTPETPLICAERGFKYIVGMRNSDVPFIIRVGAKRLVAMNSYDFSDFGTFGARPAAPRDVLDQWRDSFDGMYEEGQDGEPKLLIYGCHPFLARMHRTRPLEELIRYVQSRPGVWITTRAAVADWILTRYPEMDLSTLYPEAATSDRVYGLGIGLGGDEAVAKAMKYRRKE